MKMRMEQTAGLTLAHNQFWAVKTGTTDEAKDLWTVGATPHYTVAVWAGDDTPQPQDNASVGQATKEIFKQTMDLLNNGKEDVDFQMPSSVQKVGNQLVTRHPVKQTSTGSPSKCLAGSDSQYRHLGKTKSQ